MEQKYILSLYTHTHTHTHIYIYTVTQFWTKVPNNSMEENKTFQQMVLELGINMEKNETCTLYHVKKKKKSNLKWTIRLIGKPKYVKSMPLCYSLHLFPLSPLLI